MKFRKKPAEIEAIKFDGHSIAKAIDFSDGIIWSGQGEEVNIDGKKVVKKGDWIIKNDKGEISSCKPDIFEKTYERIDDKTTVTAGFKPPIDFEIEESHLYCPGCGKPKILCLHDTTGCTR